MYAGNSELANAFDGKVIKGLVTEVDNGGILSNVTIQSGKRMFSVVLPLAEAVKCGVKTGEQIFCIIQGKDITLVTDIKEYMTQMLKDNPGLQTHLVTGAPKTILS